METPINAASEFIAQIEIELVHLYSNSICLAFDPDLHKVTVDQLEQLKETIIANDHVCSTQVKLFQTIQAHSLSHLLTQTDTVMEQPHG